MGPFPTTDLSSGLVEAWVKDLNRDGKVEIAIRDYITGSVGEVLSIYRQKSEHSLKFKFLQGVPGDQAKVVPKKRKPAVLAVFLKSNHAADGREHNERWKWSKTADQWTCVEDCGGRAG